MRKLIATLLALTVLGLGSGLAQDAFDDDVNLEGDTWVGISTGFPFGVNLHFGFEDMIGEGIDLRANAALGLGSQFGLGADVLADLPIDMDNPALGIYAGGGPNFSFVAGNAVVSLGLLVGGEFRLGDAGLPEGGIFAEVGPTLTFVPAFVPNANAKFGFNYHF